MIAQHDIRPRNHTPPIRYGAVDRCLSKLAEEARKLRATVHMPRIGCKRAGGRWSVMEPKIERFLAGIEVYVYDPPGHSYNK